MKGQLLVINDNIKIASKKYYIDPSITKLEYPGVINSNLLANESHNLLGVIHKSFCDHMVPLISPDIVLITILQSLTLIIHKDPEQYGDISSKVKLTIRNDNLTLTPESTNEWANVFDGFQDLIGTHFEQKLISLSTCDFSTSTSTTKVLARLALMDMVEPFAQYTAMSFCGIPAINLRGITADWQNLCNKVLTISDIYPQLSWWIDKLEPLLFKFVELSIGVVDKPYWQSFYKWSESSGDNIVTGHINLLYPMLYSQYKKYLYKNNYFDKNGWTNFADFPTMNMSIPLTWKTLNGTQQLVIKGMMQDIIQHPDTGVLEPVGAWWIQPIE